MSFQVNWTLTADLTFGDEIEFIMLKWSELEVAKFIKLVDECIVRLQSQPNLGRPFKNKNIYRLTISKQTTLYYRFYPESTRIDLILFYNNLQDPKNLHKYF